MFKLALVIRTCVLDVRQIHEQTLPEDTHLYLATLHNHFKKFLQKLLDLITQLLERFIELIDIQLYGFNTLRCIFSLFSVDVSGLDKYVVIIGCKVNTSSYDRAIFIFA